MIIGIGNSSRGDDGLGWAFLDWIKEEFPDQEVVYRYQLNIEDAELIADQKEVLFVDATQEELEGGFDIGPCWPEHSYQLTSHALEPQVVLGLCHTVFDSFPKAHLLRIVGNQWELGTGLSEGALQNLERSVAAFHYFMHQAK